jgi:hypothetical protein
MKRGFHFSPHLSFSNIFHSDKYLASYAGGTRRNACVSSCLVSITAVRLYPTMERVNTFCQHFPILDFINNLLCGSQVVICGHTGMTMLTSAF